MIGKILARTVVDIIAHAFRQSPDVAQKCFRAKNLQINEIVALLNVWSERAESFGLGATRLVVSENLDGLIPLQFVAEPGRSITWYRNNNRNGLVYLETRVQSDEQGLQNLFTLRDSNFLDHSFDDCSGSHDGVASLIIDNAWNSVSASERRVPSLMRERILKVISLVHPDIEPVPIRRFISFVIEACSRWIAQGTAIDSAIADRLVGESLWRIGIFPDQLWQLGITDARVKRRLEVNAKHADLTSAGMEVDVSELITAAGNTQFVDEVGKALPSSQVAVYADLCRRYAKAQDEQIRKALPYFIFEQLFRKDTAGLKLGDRVKAEIEQVRSERLKELEAADVLAGLNARSQPDAQRFLALAGPISEPSLADLLTNRTRRAVERTAAPPISRFANPMIEFVRILQRVRNQGDNAQPRRMEVDVARENKGIDDSLALFTFLYASALVTISESVSGVPGECELVLSEALIRQYPVRALEVDEDDDDGSESSRLPLPLRIVVRDAGGNVLEEIESIEWDPPNRSHLELFRILAAASLSPVWDAIGALHVDDVADSTDWIEAFVQRPNSLQATSISEQALRWGVDPVINDLIEARAKLRDGLRATGISVELLNAYTDSWKNVLTGVRENHVPDGSRTRVLIAFVGCDTLYLGSSARRLMSPLHALRLRWIARYSQRCIRLATECFSGQVSFGTGDGEQYLDWLANLTPHESPPTTSGEAGEVLYARSESGWFEDFSALDNVTSDVKVDANALETIASRIADYLEAHPYKRDGLSLLVVLPPSNELPAELVRLVARGPNSDMRMMITIATPKSRWEHIARLIEALPAEERGSAGVRVFPARDLAFLDYSVGDDLNAQLEHQAFDVSVVAHVLQESISSQPNTEPPSDRSGAFDPVLDRPIHMESSSEGGAISIVMRPRSPDVLLESWGTLVVRSHRTRAVSPSQPENIDFIELRIDFQRTARVFRALHEHSHWVITLEQHISRDQIESSDAGAPDVLSIETGVGNNGLNTLIVSSHSGRMLIAKRLSRKLAKLVPEVADGRVAAAMVQDLALRVYDETRRLSPHLALQAMGVARVTEEILGLCIARRVVDEEVPVNLDDGLCAWLSLDEHASWFGGANNLRADMCRLTMRRTAGAELEVDILVLEGKFRQVYDSHGVAQVKRTVELLQSVLGHASTEQQREHVDADMWRERILSAIETTSDQAIDIVDPHGQITPLGRSRIPEDIREMFREGRYVLRSIEGLYSVCLWDSNASERVAASKDGVRVVTSSKKHILELIQRQPRTIALPETNALADDSAEANAASGDLPQTPTDFDASGALEDPDLFNVSEVSSAQPTESETETHVAPMKAKPATARGMDRNALAQMYDEILACFAAHNVNVSAATVADEPYVQGPASVLFKVRAGTGVDPKKLFERSQSLKLQLELEQEQNVSFDIDRGFVTIDVPKRSEYRYFIDAADMWRRWTRPEGLLIVPLGEDRFGDIVTLEFSSPNSPHLLVAGTTGSGKSEALNTILFGLVRYYMPSELRLMLVDPKGTELIAFERSEHLLGQIGFEDADALELLKSAVEEMQRRYALFREKGSKSLVEFNANSPADERIPWWVIVLDEYADLTHDPQSKKSIEQELKRLAQKARAAGIHLVIATQKPSAEVISTNLRSNLPSQLALRVKSGTESRVVLDESGAENLNGKGDALLKADGKLVRVQCARVALHDQTVGKPEPAQQ